VERASEVALGRDGAGRGVAAGMGASPFGSESRVARLARGLHISTGAEVRHETKTIALRKSGVPPFSVRALNAGVADPRGASVLGAVCGAALRY
jgi:hypothetical protein